jgi:hypothetical protein
VWDILQGSRTKTRFREEVDYAYYIDNNPHMTWYKELTEEEYIRAKITRTITQ